MRRIVLLKLLLILFLVACRPLVHVCGGCSRLLRLHASAHIANRLDLLFRVVLSDGLYLAVNCVL